MELSKYPKTGNVRTFHVEAIQIPIVYNRYGDYDPNGLLYVLEEDAEEIKREALKRFEMEIPQPYEKVQPLVLRVNLGDTVKIRFQRFWTPLPSVRRNVIRWIFYTGQEVSTG